MTMNPIDVIANAIRAADGDHTMSAAQLAEVAIATVAEFIDALDGEVADAVWPEEDYNAGWHHALDTLRQRLGLEA